MVYGSMRGGRRRRTNRLVIDFTTSEPLGEKEAALGLQNLLERWFVSHDALWDTPAGRVFPRGLTVRVYSRVVAADIEQRRRHRAAKHGGDDVKE